MKKVRKINEETIEKEKFIHSGKDKNQKEIISSEKYQIII